MQRAFTFWFHYCHFLGCIFRLTSECNVTALRMGFTCFSSNKWESECDEVGWCVRVWVYPLYMLFSQGEPLKGARIKEHRMVANAKEPLLRAAVHTHTHTHYKDSFQFGGGKVFGAFGIKAKPSGLNRICDCKGPCLNAILLPKRMHSHRDVFLRHRSAVGHLPKFCKVLSVPFRCSWA